MIYTSIFSGTKRIVRTKHEEKLILLLLLIRLVRTNLANGKRALNSYCIPVLLRDVVKSLVSLVYFRQISQPCKEVVLIFSPHTDTDCSSVTLYLCDKTTVL